MHDEEPEAAKDITEAEMPWSVKELGESFHFPEVENLEIGPPFDVPRLADVGQVEVSLYSS